MFLRKDERVNRSMYMYAKKTEAGVIVKEQKE